MTRDVELMTEEELQKEPAYEWHSRYVQAEQEATRWHQRCVQAEAEATQLRARAHHHRAALRSALEWLTERQEGLAATDSGLRLMGELQAALGDEWALVRADEITQPEAKSLLFEGKCAGDYLNGVDILAKSPELRAVAKGCGERLSTLILAIERRRFLQAAGKNE